MADITVHPSSIEQVYVGVLDFHPINQDVDISSLAVEVALPVEGSPPTTWVTTAWESGTWRNNGKRYYLARIPLGTGSFILTNGTTYQSWARVTTSGSNKFYVKGGRVVASNV